jgi:uncharacterized protein (TIGR02757 family)
MQHLAEFLNPLYDRFHEASYLDSDPLEFVHRHRDPLDQEVVAFVSALLAYGNVVQIRKSVEAVLKALGQIAPSPAAAVKELESIVGWHRAEMEFQGFVHRFNVGSDIVELLALIARSQQEWGSVGAHFTSYLDSNAETFEDALNALIADWRVWRKTTAPRRFRKDRDGFDYLLTAPVDGSCCKRWCMLLRWMGRKDRLDPGLWRDGSELARRSFLPGRSLSARQLVMPLDTHTGRISQYLGLTRRKSLNWLAAREVTKSLKECDPQDPTRYDFALARLGILDLCTRRYRPEVCEGCDLRLGCRYALSGGARASG